jgi:hypothetical protein
MDLSWITHQDVTKEQVRPECRSLMDNMVAQAEYQWDMISLPLGDDREKIEYWGKQLGFDYKNQKERGTLVLTL